MPRMLYDYTRSTLERVSFDQALFRKELRKASKCLLPYEIEQLRKWLQNFTSHKPELQQYINIVN
jgi:DNA replication protein DnaD